jgi:hypothetical protein
MIRFTRLRMVDHHIHFTLGSHIRFGSLDFLCMGVDHDLVLLPPSMLDYPTSPLGYDQRVGELDPADTEWECTLPSPARSPNSPADVDFVIESMVGLCLHANEAHASKAGASPQCHPRTTPIPRGSPLPLLHLCQCLGIALGGATALQK